jgi:predicted regulator of Ras-like GTPase activity (Roadblock/LC7/MglB family)
MVNTISLQEQITNFLQGIKSIKGVEHCVLTQRDGNPIQSVGIWLSKNEVFNVSASTSAIYNCGLQIHKNNLKYILIEGNRAKILISPLKNTDNPTLKRIIEAQSLQNQEDDFFIALSTHPQVNLGGVMVKTKQSLMDIKKALILSGESFKPPLRHYDQSELEKIYLQFNAKDDLNKIDNLNLTSFNITDEINNNLQSTVQDYGKQILDLEEIYVAIDGGFVTTHITTNNELLYNVDSRASMTYSIFSTADKCAWFLKKMHIDSILLECQTNYQFINRAGNGILSTTILKGRQKLGLLRLIIPRYAQKIGKIIEEGQKQQNFSNNVIDIKSLFTELIL